MEDQHPSFVEVLLLSCCSLDTARKKGEWLLNSRLWWMWALGFWNPESFTVIVDNNLLLLCCLKNKTIPCSAHLGKNNRICWVRYYCIIIRKLGYFLGIFHLGMSNSALWHVQTVIYKRSGIKKEKALWLLESFWPFSLYKTTQIKLRGRGRKLPSLCVPEQRTCVCTNVDYSHTNIVRSA